MAKATRSKKRKKRAKKGSPFRGFARLAWGVVMLAILFLFGISLIYRLQGDDSEAVPVNLVTETLDQTITVAILNGCGEAGLAAYVREVMLPDDRFDIVEVGNADAVTYGETLVADVSGNPEMAIEVAKYLRSRMGLGRVIKHRMAEPLADVVVILGADAKRTP